MFSLLLTCGLLTAPDELEGKVVRIADGDTLTVLVDRQQVRVPLSAIEGRARTDEFAILNLESESQSQIEGNSFDLG